MSAVLEAGRADRTDRTDRTWTVRQLADELGVTIRTLRFYEAEGLISPLRSGTNRVYSQRDRARLRLILRGKRFGMSLAECREIVDMYDGAATSERRQLETLLGRLGDIAADLRARQDALHRTLAEVTDAADMCRSRLSELPDLSE
jgi:DNA-binding transcriptional MerR regulator